jgi:hypothetical protein
MPEICKLPGLPSVGMTVIVVLVQLPPSIVERNVMAKNDANARR